MPRWPFTRRCRAVLEQKNARLEVEGDAEFVERSLALFLAQQKSLARARVQPCCHAQLQVPRLRQRRRSGRRQFIRLHAMEGPLSKVYPLDPRRLKKSPLSRCFNWDRIASIYVDAGMLSRRLKGSQNTVWHARVPVADPSD